MNTVRKESRATGIASETSVSRAPLPTGRRAGGRGGGRGLGRRCANACACVGCSSSCCCSGR